MAGRPINENLATAKLCGDKLYTGSTHEPCGTNLRYTSGGGCVHCARAKQTEMRNALRNQQDGKSTADAFIEHAASSPLTAPQHAIIPEPWD